MRTLALAGIVYGVATVAHGSGFLAVFVAGVLVGDVDAPFKGEIEVFQEGLAALAEIVAFVALGLTIDLSGARRGSLARGARGRGVPGLRRRSSRCSWPVRCGRRALFVMWGG